MIKRTICQDVFIENNLLNGDILSKIKDKILELKSTCSTDNGYIMEVCDNIEILDNIVSENGVFVKVQFSIKAFKPMINNKYDCVVKLIYSQYILGTILGQTDILIDCHNLKDFKFVKGNNTFSNGKDEIKVGSNIEAKITMMKFINQKFNCIGTLI